MRKVIVVNGLWWSTTFNSLQGPESLWEGEGTCARKYLGGHLGTLAAAGGGIFVRMAGLLFWDPLNTLFPLRSHLPLDSNAEDHETI